VLFLIGGWMYGVGHKVEAGDEVAGCRGLVDPAHESIVMVHIQWMYELCRPL
jgi:hypothetical protein